MDSQGESMIDDTTEEIGKEQYPPHGQLTDEIAANELEYHHCSHSVLQLMIWTH